MKDLPAEWNLKVEMQRDIATYEMLAQVVLFWARARHLPRNSSWELHGLSDNTPTEGAACKLFTTADPLKHAVQCMAGWASFLGAFVHVSHIPGKFNETADALSRKDWGRCPNLRPDRQVDVPLHAVCVVDTRPCVFPAASHRPPPLQSLLQCASPVERASPCTCVCPHRISASLACFRIPMHVPDSVSSLSVVSVRTQPLLVI